MNEPKHTHLTLCVTGLNPEWAPVAFSHDETIDRSFAPPSHGGGDFRTAFKIGINELMDHYTFHSGPKRWSAKTIAPHLMDIAQSIHLGVVDQLSMTVAPDHDYELGNAQHLLNAAQRYFCDLRLHDVFDALWRAGQGRGVAPYDPETRNRALQIIEHSLEHYQEYLRGLSQEVSRR